MSTSYLTDYAANPDFRPIPGWDGYAVTIDGGVWMNLSDPEWQPVPIRHLQTGPNSVWLRSPRGQNKAFSVRELVERAFGVAVG